jgi:hypothetical protein
MRLSYYGGVVRKTYLIETPKHFVAIARSRSTAAFGKVNREIAKNEARL